MINKGFPGGTVAKNLPNNRKSRIRKIPWRRRWHSTPAFLPRKSHGQRNLTGPWDSKELDTTE